MARQGENAARLVREEELVVLVVRVARVACEEAPAVMAMREAPGRSTSMRSRAGRGRAARALRFQLDRLHEDQLPSEPLGRPLLDGSEAPDPWRVETHAPCSGCVGFDLPDQRCVDGSQPSDVGVELGAAVVGTAEGADVGKGIGT